MEHWKITLEGYGEFDFGYVITKDGEVIGTWAVDENDFCSFTHNGGQKPIFLPPLLVPYCTRVAEWHKGQ